MNFTRSIAPVLAAGFLVAGLAACSSSTPAAAPAKTDSSASESATPTASATPKASSADAGSGSAPAWALPITTPGTLLTTASGTNFKVDIYEVGTATASKSGQFVTPDTNLPIIAAGDTIVYVNYVVTNTSTEPIPLGFSLATVEPRYADWPYLQGMDSIVDSAQYETMKVNTSGLNAQGADAPFVLGAGESYSYGQNFKYQAASPITFKATLTPVDASGDLNHDLRQEVSVDSTIN